MNGSINSTNDIIGKRDVIPRVVVGNFIQNEKIEVHVEIRVFLCFIVIVFRKLVKMMIIY
jgi:hypothetical protein